METPRAMVGGNEMNMEAIKKITDVIGEYRMRKVKGVDCYSCSRIYLRKNCPGYPLWPCDEHGYEVLLRVA